MTRVPGILKFTIFLATCALTLAACTSPMVMGTVYNAAAGRFADRAISYADFDTAQRQTIEDSFRKFHKWHRVSELPAYSDLMNNFASTLVADSPIEQSQIKQWFDSLQERTTRGRECSPISGAADFFTEMTDWQIRQMERKLKTNRQERLARYQKESVEERLQRRIDTMTKWASRAGVDLSEEQKTSLATALSQQTSMGTRRFKLWEDWTDQFISLLLEDRDKAQFPDQIQSHISNLWDLTERNYPEEWKQNRDLWLDFAHSFLNDMTATQKSSLARTVASLSHTAASLARKRSRTKPICFSS